MQTLASYLLTHSELSTSWLGTSPKQENKSHHGDDDEDGENVRDKDIDNSSQLAEERMEVLSSAIHRALLSSHSRDADTVDDCSKHKKGNNNNNHSKGSAAGTLAFFFFFFL